LDNIVLGCILVLLLIGIESGFAEPICETASGNCYYVSNKPGSGSGTFDNPFGMDDLPRIDRDWCSLSSPAIEILHPDDILYFRGGVYPVDTCNTTRPNGGKQNVYHLGYLRPDRPGEPGKPITFKAYPGESVIIELISGGQPAISGDDYVVFDGFHLRSPTKSAGIRLGGCTGVEIRNCIVEGKYAPTMGNHDGIRNDHSTNALIHNCLVRNVSGDGLNSCG
jgi:hypothetical protein